MATTEPKNRPGSTAQSLLLLAALLLAIPLWYARGTTVVDGRVSVKRGEVIEAAFTLITADRDNLACASSSIVDGNACKYLAPGTLRVPSPPAEKMLTQFMTTDRQMFLVAGLFEQPAIRSRYLKEPPRGVPIDKLQRFTADCRIILLDDVESALVWHPDAPWEPPIRVPVAVPVNCIVVEPFTPRS